MQNLYEVIKTIAVTEKSTDLTEQDKYTFVVAGKARKGEIKHAVEFLFDRQVAAVNVMNYKGKSRRTRYGLGKRPDWKKAIVTLKPGQKPLDFF